MAAAPSARLRVTPDMDAAEVGDEPLLHARDGAAWVSRDRFAGALAAAQAGAHVIIMDDGFQNPALAKDLCIIAVDPAYGVGNGQVFPAGPLRERLSDGLARADAIVMLHNTWSGDTARAARMATRLRASRCCTQRSHRSAKRLSGPLVAFAGLARPEKFFDTSEARGRRSRRRRAVPRSPPLFRG